MDRRWWVLVSAAAMTAIQMAMPVFWTGMLPIAVVAVIVWVYRAEMAAYDLNVVKRPEFGIQVFNAVTIGIIGQAAGSILVIYGLGIQPPVKPMEASPAIVITAVLFSAVLEEVVFRKFIFGMLKPKVGFWAAAVASSVLFALAHHDYSAYAGFFILGIIWCKIYDRTRNVGVVIAAHILFNFIFFIVSSIRLAE